MISNTLLLVVLTLCAVATSQLLNANSTQTTLAPIASSTILVNATSSTLVGNTTIAKTTAAIIPTTFVAPNSTFDRAVASTIAANTTSANATVPVDISSTSSAFINSTTPTLVLATNTAGTDGYKLMNDNSTVASRENSFKSKVDASSEPAAFASSSTPTSGGDSRLPINWGLCMLLLLQSMMLLFVRF